MSIDTLNRDKSSIYLQEFESLRSEIVELKKEVNRALERSSIHQVNSLIREMKGDLSRPLINYMLSDTKETVENGFCTECENKELCKQAFSSLLQEMALILIEENVTTDSLEHFRKKFEELKELASSDDCDSCVNNVSDIFEKQMALISSFNRSQEIQGQNIELEVYDMPDAVVTEICEPLSNKQRLTILRSLRSDTMSFSELSKVTGLRGGNLLFHLQKLLDTGMIIQRSERGDYIITHKGHLTLNGMAELYRKLKNYE